MRYLLIPLLTLLIATTESQHLHSGLQVESRSKYLSHSLHLPRIRNQMGETPIRPPPWAPSVANYDFIGATTPTVVSPLQ